MAHLADRRPAELSGEQQRVGLARALARKAPLYLFDEPTAHLDTQVRAVFLEELANRQRETGAAAVYASHDPEEALGLADRVALLVDGKILQVGTPEQVYNEPVSSAAATLTGPSSVLTLPRSSTGMLVRPDWGTLGGDRPATVSTVRFRGPHSDYLLDTEGGRLLLRVPGISVHSPGDQVSWTLTRSWPLDVTDQVPSSPAGPE